MKKARLYKNVSLWLFGLIGLCLVLIGQTAIAQDKDDNDYSNITTKIIPYDWVDDKGVLKGGTAQIKVDLDRQARALDSYPEWPFETIIDNGPTWNRVDLVIVGDGYDFNDINDGIYKSHVNSIINRFFLIDGFFSQSPLDEYASFFNVHRVDVNSVDSGVSYDPCDCNCLRNTALSMRFHVTTRRLLYIPVADRGAVMDALNQAPDYNVGLALGNTETYGGSGDEPACLAGGSQLRVETALHEFGHSFANLGDEYFETGSGSYPGTEEELEANLSTYDANDMNDNGAKWYRWLDWGPEPKDVWTRQGGRYYELDIYRPTDNSMMRALRDDNDVPYPFYQVNAEQLIFKIYELVKPIDYATPAGTYAIGTKFFVQPVKPAAHSLDVTWYVVGDPDPVGTGPEFDSSTLNLPTGQYTLKVQVIDNTDMVRDEGKRATDMNEVLTWTIGEAAHWKLDEASGGTAYDSIGDNDGTLGADPCDPNWVNDPNHGWCLDFDGVDDYVSLSTMNSLADNTTTIAAWINIDTEVNDFYPIVTQFDDVNVTGYYLYVYGNTPYFWLDVDVQAPSSETISKDNWYHIAGTNDGSSLKIYVNGVLRGTDSSIGSTGGSYDAYIGSHGDSNDAYYFNGTIDDVRVYDWAMDQAQIWEIMYPGASKFSVKDNSGVLMAWFDDLGNLFLRGSLTQDTTPVAYDNIDDFRIQDSNGVDVAIIDAANGNMYIKGSYTEGVWPGPGPSAGDNNFIIKDGSDNAVAYIDDPNGDLYLKGKLFEPD
ncbi:MAG: hypothetical protein FVQ85_07250 [Planctomycetes bacterium]|nr:hypothetical protein [Planctomycetota bacterium]